MSPRSPEERYIDWLNRMDIPIEQQTDIETLRKYLSDEFSITKDAQVTALWGATKVSDLLADYGIYYVGVRENWGINPRFAVQGLAGLWNWESIQGIIAAEEYE